jgi:hypothetical protein
MPEISSVLYQKFIEKVTDASVVIPVNLGNAEVFEIPGSRVALASALG